MLIAQFPERYKRRFACQRISLEARRASELTVSTAIFSPFSIVPSRSSFSKIHFAPLFPIRSQRSLSSTQTPTATSTTLRASDSAVTPSRCASACAAASMRESASRRLTAVGRDVRRYAVRSRRRWRRVDGGEERAEDGKEGDSRPLRMTRSSAAIPRAARDAMAGAPRI